MEKFLGGIVVGAMLVALIVTSGLTHWSKIRCENNACVVAYVDKVYKLVELK